MRKSENNLNRVHWIDGLKLLACFCVFISHFCGVFITSDITATEIGLSVGLYNFISNCRILLNGNFWVAVFCILSGYLAWFGKIRSISDFIRKTFLRYLRFVVPFFFLSFLILIIERTIGFKTMEYAQLLSNDWLACFYNERITIKMILKCIFLFDDNINDVLWVIRPIFVGNVMIYLFKLFYEKITINTKIKDATFLSGLFFLFATTVLFKLKLVYSVVCLSGAFICQCKDYIKDVSSRIFYILLGLVIFVFHFHNDMVSYIMTKVPFVSNINEDYLLINTCWNILYAFIILVILFKTSAIQRILESKPLKKLNYISFSVYILHCPLIFSMSLVLYNVFKNHLSYTMSFVVNFFITTIVLIIISVLYEKTIGKICERIMGKIRFYVMNLKIKKI